jgi:hypothetical protein
MATFPFLTDEKSEAFCHSIAHEMVRRFAISESEALYRISRFWAHLPEIIGEKDVIYHEAEDYWASTIYYGAGSYWWFVGEERLKRSLPPLCPQPLDGV